MTVVSKEGKASDKRFWTRVKNHKIVRHIHKGAQKVKEIHQRVTNHTIFLKLTHELTLSFVLIVGFILSVIFASNIFFPG